ncbi:hypothetical protein PybrP1_000113 [[Pythium] brassicae (nom. inval.)]|nr:hypothetical protein PybrP1_000113 [[Pythium] brassicae (nom. inval.)]
MSCAAAPLQLRSVPGFFVQGDSSALALPPFPPRMGLADDRSWADVNELVHRSQTLGPKVKLVLLLRHGEALHNADKTRVGVTAWEEHHQFQALYTDAPLTERGVAQAQDAAKLLEEQVAHGKLRIERVVVSPLDRTLQTYELAFANLPHYPASVIEAARETLGVCPCDRRNSLSTKTARYASVDFSAVADEDDVLWTAEHRESDAEIEARALEFLGEIYERHAESHFVVVSHSGFSRACYRALGLRHYRPQNAEFMPLLLTSDSPASSCAAPQ